MKKLIGALLINFSALNIIAQSVGIGTATPNASAQLDVSSSTKGMLIPRMTDAEKNAIVAPAQGLMLFNTSTNSFQYYNGVSWSNISHSGIINGTANRVARFNSPWGVAPGMMTDNGTGVGINTTSAVADASSVLDLTSTNKGLLIPRMTTLQRNAIAAPVKGLMVFDSTSNNFSFYDGTAWVDLNGGGSSNWSVSGNNIYNSNTGNVGIGTTTPDYKLKVIGSIYGNEGIMNSSLTVGGNYATGYKFSVIDGSVAIYNTTDAKSWAMNYSSSSNTLNFNEGGTTPRLSILNGGNVGIGTTNPAHKLDVVGAIRASGNIQSQGNLSVTGSATINGGGGVAYNPNSINNLKIVPFTTGEFVAILGPHAISSEGSFGLPSGFSSTPRVFVGDIDLTGGTVGQLYMVELVVYGCTTTSCKARLINHSAGSVNYSIRWNMVAIGN